MGPLQLMGRGLAVGQRILGAALSGICRGAAAFLGCPGFPRAHALVLGFTVGILGPWLRGRGDPHSVLASPHNRLEARLTSCAPAWTWLLIGSLLVASHPWLRPPWSSALRALLRLAVGLGLSRAGHALGHALEAATGSCTSPTPLGTLLVPLGDPAACRGAGHRWEGFSPAPQAFALVHCGLGLAEEAAAIGRRLYGLDKMAAASKMAAGRKMAAGYGGEEESKMAPWYKMAEESKMAAAGSGWAWPRPSWRPPPRPIGFEWAGPPRYGWGGHLGRPSWDSGHFVSGGHFEGRSGGHFDLPGRHFDPPGGHFEGRHGGHFDERHGGHFDERHGGHFEGTHLSHFDSGHFDSGGHFDPSGRHFDASARHFDPSVRHFLPAPPHLQGRHLAGTGGHLDGAGGHLGGTGGHLGGRCEAPPTALSVLYLLAVALLVTWHLLLVVTLTYRHTWARNAAGAALGWAAWALTYRGWYRWAWSPGPPGWG